MVDVTVTAEMQPYIEAAINAGWQLRKFGESAKWWHPSKDDGSRYLHKASSLRHLCEDYGLAVSPAAASAA